MFHAIINKFHLEWNDQHRVGSIQNIWELLKLEN